MYRKYKGRVIATIIFIWAITVWNIIFYGYNNYPFNLLLDLSYTLVIAAIVWWLASFYDKSKIFLENLTASEEKYKKLLDSTLHLLENIDQMVYETDERGNVTLLNPAWEKITGFSIQESLGRNIFSYIYPEDCDAIFKRVLLLIHEKEEVSKGEVRLRKKDGGFIWVEFHTKFTYNANDDIVSTFGTLTDITEWKSSEQELIQLNEDLTIQSDKLSVVAEMSAAIVHEVRNPLTSIFGFLQLLKEQNHLNPEYLDVVFSEIKRIELVLNEMLILSKPQTISLKKIDLTHSINHVVTLMKSEANLKGIELILDKLQEPVLVFGDENQLKQVFINIIKNAIEAMETSGGIIHIYHAIDHDSISIYMKDEGCGIPEETLHKIGQPFYTTKEKGTGLGLTTCFKIIENHKGKIHITSKIGVGTTFEIILPSISMDDASEGEQISRQLVDTL